VATLNARELRIVWGGHRDQVADAVIEAKIDLCPSGPHRAKLGNVRLRLVDLHGFRLHGLSSTSCGTVAWYVPLLQHCS